MASVPIIDFISPLTLLITFPFYVFGFYAQIISKYFSSLLLYFGTVVTFLRYEVINFRVKFRKNLPYFRDFSQKFKKVKVTKNIFKFYLFDFRFWEI